MNRALILMATFLSVFSASLASAEQLQWGDLEVGVKYHLITDIVFPAEELILTSDTGLLLTEVNGAIGVVNFIFQDQRCQDKKRKAEMVMYRPKNVGIELLPNCVVSMWVEGGNYFDSSALAR